MSEIKFKIIEYNNNDTVIFKIKRATIALRAIVARPERLDLWLVTCVDLGLGLGLVANCKKATSISLYFFISQESQV